MEQLNQWYQALPWYWKILGGAAGMGALIYFVKLKGTLIGFLFGFAWVAIALVSFGLISHGTYNAWILASARAKELQAKATP